MTQEQWKEKQRREETNARVAQAIAAQNAVSSRASSDLQHYANSNYVQNLLGIKTQSSPKPSGEEQLRQLRLEKRNKEEAT
jgi:hypothetical protein